MTRVLGIDPSSRKLAVCISRSRKGEFELVAKKLAANHADGSQQAYAFMEYLIHEQLQEDKDLHVYLEKPVMGVGGPQATIVQAYISGAVMAAVRWANIPLTQVNNQSWKKRVCGRGNINKAEVGVRMLEVWPELIERADGDQDFIDAGAINLFGWHVLTLREKIKRGMR